MATRKNNGNNIKLRIPQEQENKILRKIVDLTASDMDLARILKEIVQIVNEMAKADSVFIYLFDSRHQQLKLMASKIPHKKMLGKIALKVGEGITGLVAQEKKTVAIKKNAYKD